MSPQEQDAYLGTLLVEKRQIRQTIACLTSKVRRIKDLMEHLEEAGEVNASDLFSQYAPVLDTDIGKLVVSMEKLTTRLSKVTTEIKTIDGA